jgi:hypothetical protein
MDENWCLRLNPRQKLSIAWLEPPRTGAPRPLAWSLDCKTLLCLCLLFLVFVMVKPVTGQEDEDTPRELWLSYEHRQNVSERVRVSGTLGYRELLSDERFFGEWTQLHLKADASYEVNPKFRIAGGLGAFATYRPDIEDFYELRLWQEAKVFWPDREGWVRRFVLAHRFRLEERFLESDGWEFSGRFRYRLQTKIALNRYDLEPGSFFLLLAAEWFAELGTEAAEVYADRGLVSLGFGYVHDPRWTFELRFHSQRSRVNVDEPFDTTGGVIDFRVKTSVRIMDRLKGR